MYLRRAFLVLLLAVTAAFASAQPTQIPADNRAPGQPQTPRPRSYKLQPEDLIRVQVYNETQVTADVPIGRDGYVSAPFVGSVLAQGKTVDELQATLTDLYRDVLKLKRPIVSVTILKYRIVTATIGGFVNKPGTYEVRPGDKLLALLNLGGGFIPDRSDLRRTRLRRANSREVIPIDLYAMLILGDTSQNYEVEDGDELTVPEERRNRILVQGAITTPGAFAYHEPMTLMDAISLAGGEIRYRSMLSKVLIIREQVGQPGQYTRIMADYVRFVKKGDQTQNVTLQPGDFIYIPETKTPDFNQISSLANVAFITQQFGNTFFGLRLFSR